ncbi:MAG: hypothetical protein ACTSSI_04530 [Candidatus Helarchaeota archaeon]
MQDAIKNEKLVVIDCYGTVTYPDVPPIKEVTSLENPTDISKLRYLVEMTRERFEQVQNVRWIVDDITNMVITIGSEEKVLRLLREFFFLLKKNRDLGLFYVDRKALSLHHWKTWLKPSFI